MISTPAGYPSTHNIVKYVVCIIIVALSISPGLAERLVGLQRMERFDQLPVLMEGTQVRQVSSHDRSGGNDDGFNGTYSALYVDENGEYVLFDEVGDDFANRIFERHARRRVFNERFRIAVF